MAVVRKITKHKAALLKEAIDTLEQAAREDEVKGAGHPDDIEIIEDNLIEASGRVVSLLASITEA